MSADILKKILAVKAEEVAAGKAERSLAEIKTRAADQPACRDFAGRLRQRAATSADAVIAEIKRASPSAGVIRADFDPADIARSYQRGGATCLSVLTDQPFFQGHSDYLVQARAACDLPVLRKDFIIDAWQVWETRALGADALLLIVAALDDARLADLAALGNELGLAVLVEVHDEAELTRALAVPGELIGINNRDLRTFETSLATTERLMPLLGDDCLAVAESGLATSADLARLSACGVNAFLVGETLMRQADVTAATRALL
ncbi:MAG: indole-3-glycerol phosphate synthase TrpC, partial [Wenzhouxiangella sp.]